MKCAAIIIENRDIPGLQQIITAHAAMLPTDWDIVHINDLPVKTIHDYNRFMTQPSTWTAMPWDRVLIFQHDSELLRPGIEEFLEAPYLGAPIRRIRPMAFNGGLSLREPLLMAEICQKYPWRGEGSDGNEDIYFSHQIRNILPIESYSEMAVKFACETIFQLGTLGTHAIDRWLTPEQCNKIRNQYVKP